MLKKNINVKKKTCAETKKTFLKQHKTCMKQKRNDDKCNCWQLRYMFAWCQKYMDSKLFLLTFEQKKATRPHFSQNHTQKIEQKFVFCTCIFDVAVDHWVKVSRKSFTSKLPLGHINTKRPKRPGTWSEGIWTSLDHP